MSTTDTPSAEALAAEMDAARSDGHDEWRVQDPADGAYCIAYSWPDVANPQREARAWLADQQHRFPKGRYAGYVVACVRVQSAKDRLLGEAATMLRSLAAERDALRAALSEVDRIMGHDEDATEWRERSAHLWAQPAATPPQQEPTA